MPPDRAKPKGQRRPLHRAFFFSFDGEPHPESFTAAADLVLSLQVDHTIENRILRIQDRKEALVSHTLGGVGESDAAKNLELLFSD